MKDSHQTRHAQTSLRSCIQWQQGFNSGGLISHSPTYISLSASLHSISPQRTSNVRSSRVFFRHALSMFSLFWLMSAICTNAADPNHGDRISIDEDMTAYKSTEASGVVAALRHRLDSGESQLEYNENHGYLESLLEELRVSTSSQLLVASKTSANHDLISPQNPRALYFNEAVQVAYVPGANLIEIAANDPKLGVVFYTLKQKPVPKPRVTRDNRCLECHASSKTLNVPGLIVRSFLTKDGGEVDLLSGITVNHRTPIADRWGGYYVTGSHGAQSHRGNAFGPNAIDKLRNDQAANGNILKLDSYLDTSKYPSPGSDIVSLMVLEHQAHMQNLLTRLNFETRQVRENNGNARSFYPAVEAVLKYLLFTEEQHLIAPVKGTSNFTKWFEAQGPRDSQGRSLYDFDLENRLFKYPCSYLIYTDTFDAIDIPGRRHLYRRLWQVLTGEDKSATYRNIPSATKQAIREILLNTKAGLPAYWRL